MKHFGDITKIDGHDVPTVDVIVGGSPCQDLSIAGKREGFNGERSSLFLDQIRIIKEMHDECKRTNQPIRPRFQVWENVPGCTSSNGGDDFRTVLEQTARIIDPNAVIPRPSDGQCWSNVGCILADGWSIAWRIHDGQFWGKTIIDRRTGNIIKMGTPQRRRRLSLVADFGGQSAPEILFDRESLSRDIQPRNEGQEELAANVGMGLDKPIAIFERAGKDGGEKGILTQVDRTMTLSASNNQFICQPTICLEGNGSRSSHHGDGFAESDTMYTLNTVENHAVCYRKMGHPMSAEEGQGWEETNINDTLKIYDSTEARTPTVICQPNYIKLESEVAVRKYPVDTERLIECLQNHRSITVKEIAEKLNQPKSMVEHWFRKDEYFAVPDAEIWPDLKALLGIETDEFDESIMTYEYKACNFDTANRIHMGDVAPTMTADCKDATFCLSIGNGQAKDIIHPQDDVARSLNCMHDAQAVCVGVDMYNQNITGDKVNSICAARNDPKHLPTVYQQAILRKLTPLECERLQGFPDGWTDIGEWTDSKGKKRQASDSLRYTALGNSICLPFWEWLFSRIGKFVREYTDQPTMASLFDGIGGFPLVASRNGFRPVWASEIEEFPIAVTKYHFPEGEERKE